MIREAGGRRREHSAPTRAVMLGLPGEIAFALVGRVERRESSVNLYGYLTAAAGLSADELFTDPANPVAESHAARRPLQPIVRRANIAKE